MNGLRDANADVVATLASARTVEASSGDTQTPQGSGPSELIFAFWDDGDSIAETLQTAQGLTAPEGASDDLFARTITVTQIDDSSPAEWTISNQGPVQKDEPSSLLLAATFPGISSKPDEPSGALPDVRVEMARATRAAAARDELARNALPGACSC